MAAASASIDAGGDYATAALTSVKVTARIATAFAIGGKTGQTKNALQVLICDDSAAPTGLLTTCLAPAP